MSNTSELRVFISSTFRDLHEEREHLIKKIFPEIRALCRERGVTFTEVDLRWGLTEEEATLGRIVRICLEEVDKCRPYFIGLIGNRYGWAPELHEIQMDPELLDRYAWIDEAVLEGASLTEMEFIHGVFNAPVVDGQSAFFYRHDVDLSQADDPLRLERLIEQAERSGRPMRQFTETEALGRMVHDDLLALIDRHWPLGSEPTPLERERRSHGAFARSRRRAYIAQREYLERFDRWIGGSRLEPGTVLQGEAGSADPGRYGATGHPLVIVGDSGLGKSSLVAHLVEVYRRKNPNALIIEHYVGASRTSGTAMSVMRHIVEEIRARFAIDEELPTKPEELERSFPNWLFRCEHLAGREGIAVVIAIDAVNQLDEGGRRLAWLPKTIPSGLRLIVSTTREESYRQLRERAWEELEVAPLHQEAVRASIVVRYLAEFHKGISPTQVKRLTTDGKSQSPLFLRTIAEELRLHGAFETLDEVIERYVTAADLDEVFQRVLERMERDYGVEAIETLTTLIWASRSGLSETELMELGGMSRLELSTVLFALDYHLIRHDGVLGFFHDYLRRAVEKRYLAEEHRRRERHRHLATHFEAAPVTLRSTRELLHALAALGERARLAATLATIERFMLLDQGETGFELRAYWAELAAEFDIEGSYRASLERYRATEGQALLVVLGRVAKLLESVGRWKGAEALQLERLSLAVAGGDQAEEAGARVAMGMLLRMQGDHERAFEELTRGRDLLQALGDHQGLSYAIGSLGILHYIRGEYDCALECYLEQERISRELGNRRGLSNAICCMGIVYAIRADQERALENFSEYEQICRELGDRRGLATAIGNKGMVLYDRGEYERVLECYGEQERICREIGDRSGELAAIGNIGLVYTECGQYDRALEYLRRASEEHRAIGSRHGLTHWLVGTSRVLIELAARGDAMPGYLARHLPDVTPETWRSMSLRVARQSAGECLAISRELSTPDTLYSSQVLLARIDAAEGNTMAARESLQQLLEEVADDQPRADLHYWLWGIGRGSGVESQESEDPNDHGAEALRLYTALIDRNPKYEYLKRIEELGAAVNGDKGGDAGE